nr:ubiquitin hydrolase [Tanacetum cinerariifolium]
SPAVEGFVNSSKILEIQENQSDKGYHEVPLSFTGNYMPPKRDLRLIDEHFKSESVDVSSVSSSDGKTVKTVDVKGMISKGEPKPVKKNSFSPPIIEDWVFKSKEEDEPKFQKQVQPSFPKIEFVKAKDQNQSFRKPVKQVEQAKSNTHRPRGNQRNWNNLMNQRLGSNFEFKNKACYECGSFDHLIKDCCVHQKQKMEKPVWNNARRVNHQNTRRMTHPNPKRNMISQSVLMRGGVAAVASPARVLELDTHSSSKDDPSKSSLPAVSIAPMVSPFLCLYDLESDTEIPDRHVSPTPHDAMLTRWRSRDASRSSSPITSILEIPAVPILPAPSAIVAPSFEFPLAHGLPG